VFTAMGVECSGGEDVLFVVLYRKKKRRGDGKGNEHTHKKGYLTLRGVPLEHYGDIARWRCKK
jgi:hypothetical protein